MSTNFQQVRSIFLAALERPADAWVAYLAEACAGDSRLREHVKLLLEAHADGTGMLDYAVRPEALTLNQPPLEKPGTIIGPYKLLQQIGEGGMGTVFMAEQTEPIQRTVALKIIKPGMDTRQVIARFEAERQALAMMDHPSIAKVLDAGATDTGRPYFVMDLVKGVPITEYCDKQHLSVRQRLELMAAVCQAVQHAHQKGIIHRDIKPSNVLVAEYDGKPVPKVIDFGVAKATAQRLTERTMFTQYGQIVGTFEYMSPEQARFNQLDVDTRSDIYSLGVLLYEVLAGSTPLEKERLRSAAYEEVLRIICEEEPPVPSLRLSSSQSLPSIAANRSLEPKKLTGLVRGELDWIVMKCLEKDRNRRYETANGLSMDLQRYLSDETVEACPPSAVYRFRKFARRNKVRLSIAGLILLPLILLGGGIAWTLRDRAVRQADLEQSVLSSLNDVRVSHERVNWPEAMAAVKRAEGFLATGGAMPALKSRVDEWRTNLEVVARLEDTRLSDATTSSESWRDRPAAHADYQRAFRALGIDIDAIGVEEAADRIRALPIRDELIAALDAWTLLRTGLVNEKSETAQGKPGDWSVRPVRVALAADTDEFLNRVRQAVSREDQAALHELAQSPDAVRLPATTLQLLAQRLRPSDSGDMGEQIELVKRAQQAQPDDFYLNLLLAIIRPDQSQGATFRTNIIDGRLVIGPRNNDLLLGDEAFVYAMAAVALRPRDAYARLALGETLWRAGRLDDALAAYREALRLKPDEYHAYSNIAHVLAQQGKFEEAVAACRVVTEHMPENVLAYNSLSNFLKGLGKFEESIAALQKAMELDPTDATAYLNLGSTLGTQGKRDEALAAIRKAMELDPTDTEAYYNLGTLLDDLGNFDDAIAALQKAIELRPDYSYAYNNLGSALRHSGKHEEALGAFRKAIELDPANVAAYVNLGTVLNDLGEFEEAVAASRKAIELNPDEADAYNTLGLALRNVRNREGAIAAYRKSIEIAPHDVAAYANLGLALDEQGKLDEAIVAYTKAIDLKVNHSGVYNNLATILATAPAPHRDPARALELATRATELGPTEGDAWNTLGIARYRVGQWQPAIDALEKSLKLRAGGDSNDWFFLAMAHWQLGHKEDARKWYVKAVEWTDKNQPKDENLRGFRAEAAELIGITESKPDLPPTTND